MNACFCFVRQGTFPLSALESSHHCSAIQRVSLHLFALLVSQSSPWPTMGCKGLASSGLFHLRALCPVRHPCLPWSGNMDSITDLYACSQTEFWFNIQPCYALLMCGVMFVGLRITGWATSFSVMLIIRTQAGMSQTSGIPNWVCGFGANFCVSVFWVWFLAHDYSSVCQACVVHV